MRIEKSFCRMCQGFCGVNVAIENDRVVAVRGDRDNPASLGYACVKGIEIVHALYGERRILRPLKRVGDRHVEIPLEQALDEIAERMQVIVRANGAQSLAFYRGTGFYGSNIALVSFPALAAAVGGQLFSTMTIDQSAKWVTADRLGTWRAGRHAFENSDVWLFAGSNPLVSVLSLYTPTQNPLKTLKAAKSRGMKIIVIDPRRTELAAFADIHLQIYPGEDAAVAAALIHVILANRWEDADFCARHVAGMDDLRAAVAPFTPERVAARAGIAPEAIVAAAELFARQSTRGSVNTGTGVDMARFPNLAEHLYEVIGVICGRFLRAGEILPNPGVINAKIDPRAEVIGPARSFEQAPRSRVRGAVRLNGESATPTLAEEILEPGPGRIRGVIVSGANPVAAIPDEAKVMQAFRALDLLVAVEPFRTHTTQLADYVLPPKILYEHADHTFMLELINLTIPYAQYTPALVPPPANSELCDEGYVAWALAKRMGATLQFMGAAMDMKEPPTDEVFLRLLARNSAVPFDELKTQARGGRIYADLPPKVVGEPSAAAGRFAVMPQDVADELQRFLATSSTADELSRNPEFGFRLVSRRMREVCNTSYHDLPAARARVPFNPLGIHPNDLDKLDLAKGDPVWLVSENGRIPAVVKADATLKPGVVSMTHGFGGLPGAEEPYEARGASLAPLISLDRDCEPLQAMPRMTGVPVRIERRV